MTNEATMKAAYIEALGPASAIRFGELPLPTPGPGQVLVKVEAASVNPIDTYIRSGAVAMSLPFPFVPGCDLAGAVEAVGEGVTSLKPGDRVWGSNQGLLGRQGTLAEYSAVDAAWLYPLPEGVDAKDAAATALVGITAHLGLFNRAQLKAGEVVFVNGGSGGVGSMVVQMAKAAGATVITTAGSAERVKRCKKLGADLAIDYRTQDVPALVDDCLSQIGKIGVDVFWETRREPDFEQAIAMLAERGRMVLMAGRDAKPPLPVGPFYVKGCSLLGFVMFKATPDEQRAAAEDINRWLAGGQIKANIDRVMPLSEAAAAHQLQEDNTVHGAGTLAGKIVLTPGGD